MLAVALHAAVLQEHPVNNIITEVMLLLVHDASPCADTVRCIPHTCRTQGCQLQSDIFHQLGHSHGNFCTDLHVKFAATHSFAHDNSQTLRACVCVCVCDGFHTSALTLIWPTRASELSGLTTSICSVKLWIVSCIKHL